MLLYYMVLAACVLCVHVCFRGCFTLCDYQMWFVLFVCVCWLSNWCLPGDSRCVLAYKATSTVCVSNGNIYVYTNNKFVQLVKSRGSTQHHIISITFTLKQTLLWFSEKSSASPQSEDSHWHPIVPPIPLISPQSSMPEWICSRWLLARELSLSCQTNDPVWVKIGAEGGTGNGRRNKLRPANPLNLSNTVKCIEKYFHFFHLFFRIFERVP